MTGHGREDGSVAAFLAVLAVALFALAGLVVDGGRALAEQQVAAADAEQAARAGAQAVSISSLRQGLVQLDPSAAEQAATSFLDGLGVSGVVTAHAGSVTVTVDVPVTTTILGIVGVRTITVHATATAVDLHGVTRED